MSANESWDMGQEHQQTNPFVLIHRNMRGRYTVAIVLGLIFGIAGGVLGYTSREPLYRSTGLIRVKPVLPRVLYKDEQNTGMQMFANFINTQAQLIGQSDVIENAMNSDDWRAIKDITNFDTFQDVQGRLVVRSDSRGQQETILVYFEDPNPTVSQVVVESIFDAYIEKYGREGSIKKPEIVTELNRLRLNYQNVRDVLNDRIGLITQDWKVNDLTPLINETVERLAELDAQERQLDAQLGLYDSMRAEGGGGESSQTYTVEEAARIDPTIAEWFNQRRLLEDNRIEMMASEGLREEHRDVRRITLMIEKLDERIDERIAVMSSNDEQGTSGAIVNERVLLVRDREQLRVEQDELQSRADKLFTDSTTLAQFRKQLAETEESLQLVNNRLTTIDTESLFDNIDSISGRISIAVPPGRATSPTSDPRKKMAVAGFVGAGSLPVMAIFALGYLSHRVKYSDDEVLSGAKAGIIGMLPDLGNSLDDQELASASAFAVHQIRSQLQIKNTQNATRVYGVTSPAPGDGKTSLIIAMGLSFAESGNRTLLVDLDFIGRGLSIHFGHPQAPSLAEALTDPEMIASQIHETEFPGLDVLPAGFGDDMRVSRLSPRTVSAMLDILRSKYDTILIDTGPILGSVEAAFVAPQSDGVLFVVGRGQRKPLIKKAIDQINAVDGRISATIFNRASVQEVRHASSSMSVHFSRQFSRQQQELEQRNGVRGGPVAGSMFRARAVEQPDREMRKVEP